MTRLPWAAAEGRGCPMVAGLSYWALHDASPWPSFDCPESCLPPTTAGICSARSMQLAACIADIGPVTQSKDRRRCPPKRMIRYHLHCYAWSCEQAVGCNGPPG